MSMSNFVSGTPNCSAYVTMVESTFLACSPDHQTWSGKEKSRRLRYFKFAEDPVSVLL